MFFMYVLCVVYCVWCFVGAGGWLVVAGGGGGQGEGLCVDVVWDLIVGCMMTFSFDVLGLLYGGRIRNTAV